LARLILEMQCAASNPFWQLIDGAFAINLDARPDRWAAFQAAAGPMIPVDKLHRLSARVGPDIAGFGARPWFRGGKRDKTWAGRAGCLLSHRAALLKSRELGWRTTLILEDDTALTPDFDNISGRLAMALRDNDWEICYLGFTEPWWPGRHIAAVYEQFALHQIHGATTTHAYLVRDNARDWILAQLPDEKQVWPWLAKHRAIDRWYQRYLGLDFRVVCVSPSWLNQNDTLSDIVTKPSQAGDLAAGGVVVAPTSGAAAYYFCHALRRLTVRLGLAGDTLRGWAKRLSGF